MGNDDNGDTDTALLCVEVCMYCVCTCSEIQGKYFPFVKIMFVMDHCVLSSCLLTINVVNDQE